MRSLLCLLTLVAASLNTASATAQSFSFGIGTGGYGHHHHHGGWHFDYHDCWHDHYYYPRYVYAYPAPVIRERVTYVEQTPSVSRVEPPIADTLITVQNAAGKSVAVSFLMDAQDVALRDGEVRTFSGRSSRVVEFDRGGDFGSARYDLAPGDYQFVISDRGWDLVRKPAAAASTATRPSVRKNALPAETTLR
ncbi:MAG TPA: hypothetical protein VFV87_08035 [Pirellulaceae bacterium]|nr:hypothetical protein [Pirellulaceae bacterium]